MKWSMKTLHALLFLLVGGLICKADERPATAKSTAKAESAGLVFKVTGKKAPLYLCGSIHLLHKDDYPLPAKYDAAYKEAKILVFEIPPADMKKPETMGLMMKKAMLPEGELKDVVKEATFKALEGWAKDNSLPMVLFAKMQPWMAALTVAQTAYQQLGMSAELGLDFHFGELAAKDEKTVAGFETIGFQLGLFANLSPKVQEEMILQAIEEAAEAKDSIEKMRRAWLEADCAGLAEQINESFEGFPDIKKLLLDDRNERWIPQLEKYLNGNQSVMVVVGAGHLCGTGSVVDLLRKKGWKVE